MMTKATFFKFLLQNQVPLRLAQRAVEIIDEKARTHMPLSASESDLIGIGESHVGRYYITPVRHHAAPGATQHGRAVRHPDKRGHHPPPEVPLADAAGHPQATSDSTRDSDRTEMAFIQASARIVVYEDEHPGATGR